MTNDRKFPRTTNANIFKSLVDISKTNSNGLSGNTEVIKIPEGNSPLMPSIEHLDYEFGRKVQNKQNKTCCFDGQAKINVSRPRQVC